jgi:hypothetical protein
MLGLSERTFANARPPTPAPATSTFRGFSFEISSTYSVSATVGTRRSLLAATFSPAFREFTELKKGNTTIVSVPYTRMHLDGEQ